MFEKSRALSVVWSVRMFGNSLFQTTCRTGFVLFLSLGGINSAHAANGPETICAAQTEYYNRQAGFPVHMLTAISMVESGRWNGDIKARVAWPWTVTSGSDGRFFETKQEALDHVKALRAKGTTNIDVGCMQVNLHFHGSAFKDVEEAMDPASNVAYAVTFLKRLYGETDSWAKSVTAYHSRTPVHAERYAGKIIEAWDEAEESYERRLQLATGTPAGVPGVTQPYSLVKPFQGFDPGVTPDTLNRYRTYTETRAQEYFATYGAPGASADSPAPQTTDPVSLVAPDRDRARDRWEAETKKSEEARISREKAEEWREKKLAEWYMKKGTAPR